MDIIRNNFLKGINRRFSREESSDPSFFYTLQNARLFNRGGTGKVSRIKGYDKFVSDTKDYSDVLDIITVDEQFVVLYRTGEKSYEVAILDSNGNPHVDSPLSYTVQEEDFTEGELTKTNNTVFIAPHNKIIYYKNGSWQLEEFKSGVPTIQGENTQTQNVGKAEATIEPTSVPSTTNLSLKAKANLTILTNNTVQGETDTVTLTVNVGGVDKTTDEITINYNQTENEIAQQYYYALRGENGYSDPGILTDWDISLSKNQQNKYVENSRTIYFASKQADSARNDDKISINGSKYLIVTEDEAVVLPEDRFKKKNKLSKVMEYTVMIEQPSGAISSSDSFIGPLYIRFDNINNTIQTENITTADTIASLATKIESAISGEDIEFSVDNTNNVITITADNYGEEYNGTLTLRFKGQSFISAEEIFSYNKTNFTGGQEVDANLGLKKNTDYWYKARYRYIDGHVSEDCFPIRINTGASQINPIIFDTDEKDLDGTTPKLQIFRKEEGKNFFLIKEMDVTGATTEFLDDGEVESGDFNDLGLVWTRNHKTQTILDDRLVRANVTYDEAEYTIPSNAFTLGTENTTGEESMPSNSKARFYVRPQYSDGTKGYYENIGTLDIKDGNKFPTIQQNDTLSNTDKTIEELGFYVNYRPHSQEHLYRFNSIELANQHVSTIQDNGFYPTNTRIFFGFKYLEVWEIIRDDSDAFGGVFKAVGWDSSNSGKDHGGFFFDTFDDSGPLDKSKFPQELTVNIFGVEFTYVRHAYFDSNIESTNAIYRLADYDAIKKAVSTGNVEIRLTGSNVGNLSTKHPDNEILNTKVKVKGLIDKSSQYDDASILNEDEDVLIGPLDSRLYLELDESIIDDVDNVNLTKYDLKGDYGIFDNTVLPFKKFGGVPLSERDLDNFTMSWEITNLKKVSDPQFNAYTGDGADADGGRPDASNIIDAEFYRYDWDYSKYELASSEFYDIDETAIFIGRKENTVDVSPIPFSISGVEYRDDEEITYGVLTTSNIYGDPIFKSDINIEDTEYPNQLVWSEPLNNVSGFSGGRTFKTQSFFNIDNNNGDILFVESLGNRLFVFCENGVAVVNVGEVLTTQKQGEVFVDSSRFMTNYYWINDRLVDVKRESITKYKDVIYFTDGYDVFGLSEKGLQNLTNGIIELDPNKDYYANINPGHNEYQLCDYANNETWVYNFEFQQWYGPFTYKFKDGNYVKHTYVTVDDSLYEHGIGNTFTDKDGNNVSFTTKIESVASDTKSSLLDKNFRKFYINTENDTNAVFKYGKDYNSLVNNNMVNMKIKNGFKHQGVQPSEQNNKIIYWEIETSDYGFELKDLGYSLNVKKRR